MRRALVKTFIMVMLFEVLLPAFELKAADVEGNSSGIFINPAPGSAVVNGVGTGSFSWGIGAAGSPPSNLTFAGKTFEGDFDELFSFGTLSFFNGTIFVGTEATSVDLQVSIMLTMPSGVTREINQTLTLINTINTGDPTASADLVLLPTSVPEISFTVDDIDYTMIIKGFGQITGGGGATTIDRFFSIRR